MRNLTVLFFGVVGVQMAVFYKRYCEQIGYSEVQAWMRI